MKITIETVKALNPCEDRFDNFVKNNPNFDGTVEQFLSLDNITYSDKVWVMSRFMTKNQAVLWGVACTESVLHIFETKYSKDKSVANLLNYLKSGLDFENLTLVETKTIIELRRAAADSAYAADADAAAYAAAYAAAHAADSAAYAADADDHAADSAAYAADSAAYAAADDAAYADADARQDQEDLNLLFLVIVLRS